jgi:hypothetical protein
VRSETSSGLAQRSSATTSSSLTIFGRAKFLASAEAMEPRGATLRYLPQTQRSEPRCHSANSRLFAVERTVPRLYRRIGLFARSPTARETRNYFSRAAMRNITGICF